MRKLERYMYLIASYVLLGFIVTFLLSKYNLELQSLGFLIGLAIPIIFIIDNRISFAIVLSLLFFTKGEIITNVLDYMAKIQPTSFYIGFVYSMIASKIGYSIQSSTRVFKRDKEKGDSNTTVIHINNSTPTTAPTEPIEKEQVGEPKLKERKKVLSKINFQKIPDKLSYNFEIDETGVLKLKIDIVKKNKDEYMANITLIDLEKINTMKKITMDQKEVRYIIKLLKSNELMSFKQKENVLKKIKKLYLN